MSLIAIYKPNTLEWQKLHFFCNVANNKFAELKSKYYVSIKDMYFDYGANWKYTGLLTEDLTDDSEVTRSWQSVCPRDYENIIECDSFERLEDYAKMYAELISNGKISIKLTF